MKVYKYIIQGYDNTDIYKKINNHSCVYPYGESGLSNIGESSDLVFSTEDKAFNTAKEFIKENEEMTCPFIWIVSIDLDAESADSIYTLHNLIRNETYSMNCFNTLEVKNPLYCKGDWVMFYSHDHFQIGRVSELAEGFNPYLLTTENLILSDGYTHDHVEEHVIVNKLDEEEVKRILPFKFYSNISIRSEYDKIKNSSKNKNS